ncbi:TetR/AcrR family transcriptional regulator [Streptomyces zagrosensis]|uniref:AcrR family transcriptional regulator n=1 Tax=Streptomyces zagrosensis TaxID=1042984 RepID=A0A7W9UW96_9ACTN|nr:TetR/AcrR family transcriptional regulator [Streptomyces zagrosensis]MBB5933660.1 AcrR family transcriptional regulator [Streptomyces zagrosensis]
MSSEVTGAPPTGDALTPGARRVLDAAAELFYGRGINAVGVDLIAKQAGVTKKTLYDRFGSKEALVAAYLRERDERWRRWLTARVNEAAEAADLAEVGAPEQEAARAAVRVLATFDALERWMRRENPRGCGFVNAAAELPDAAHPGRQVIADQKRWLRGYLRELCHAASASDPDTLADELVLLHEGAMVLSGLAIVDAPVRLARDVAVRALAQRGVVGT